MTTPLRQTLSLLGNIFAIAGLGMCATAGIARLFGYFYVAGFESMTLFNVGTTLLIAACLAKIQFLVTQ